jgi:hypothetical protein
VDRQGALSWRLLVQEAVYDDQRKDVELESTGLGHRVKAKAVVGRISAMSNYGSLLEMSAAIMTIALCVPRGSYR